MQSKPQATEPKTEEEPQTGFEYACLLCGQPVLREGSECYDCRNARPNALRAGGDSEEGRKPVVWWGVAASAVLVCVVFLVTAGVGSLRVSWSTQLGARPVQVVAVGGNCVVAAIETGEVVALDEATGSERWRVDAGGPGVDFTVDGGTVFCRDPENGLVAVDLRTGVVAWRFETGEPCGPAAVWSEGVVLGIGDEFVAVNRENAIELWKWDLRPGREVAFATIADGIAYLVESSGDGEDELTALDLETRQPLWTNGLGCSISAAPMLVARTVCIAGQAGDSGMLLGLDIEDGEVRWSRRGVNALPAIQGRALFTSEDGVGFVAMDKTSAAPIWRTPEDVTEIGSPVVGRDTVYFPSRGAIHALAATTGRLRWVEKLDDEHATDPAVGGSRLYWATADGSVHSAKIW